MMHYLFPLVEIRPFPTGDPESSYVLVTVEFRDMRGADAVEIVEKLRRAVGFVTRYDVRVTRKPGVYFFRFVIDNSARQARSRIQAVLHNAA